MNTEQTKDSTEMCTVCGEVVTKVHHSYPGLCLGCCDAALVTEMMGQFGGQSREIHSSLYATDLARLKNDKMAIRLIRPFTALLRPIAARQIFLDPVADLADEPHHRCAACGSELTNAVSCFAGLCLGCLQAIRIFDMMFAAPRQPGSHQDTLIQSAQNKLRNDKAAIRMIRQFPALLDSRVAGELFLQPLADR